MLEFFSEHFSFIYDVIFVFDYGISYAYNLFTVDIELVDNLIGATTTIPFNTFILNEPYVIAFIDLGLANDIFSTLFNVAFLPIMVLFDNVPLWAGMFLAYIIYGLIITVVSKLVDLLKVVK